MFKQFGVNALFVAALAVAMVGALSSAAPLDQFDGQTVVANNTRALFRFSGFVAMQSGDDRMLVDIKSALADSDSLCRYKLESDEVDLDLLASIFSNSSPMNLWSITVSFKGARAGQPSCVVRPDIEIPAHNHYNCDKTVSYACMDAKDPSQQLATLVVNAFEFEYNTDPAMASRQEFQFSAFHCQ